MSEPLHIVIAGAGIGGLATALALAQAGFRVSVLERAEAPVTVGAGIQLGPNATRVLDAIGVMGELERLSVAPGRITLRDGESGRMLAGISLAGVAESRYGAPYLVFHRADLHKALYGACMSDQRITIRHGAGVERVQDRAEDVLVGHQGGELAGDILVAADGIRSTIRAQLTGAEPEFAGMTAWRAMVRPDAAAIGGFISDVVVWAGPGGHLVHYPVSGAAMVNLVALIPGDTPPDEQTRTPEGKDIAEALPGLAAPATALVEQATGWRPWPLYRIGPLARWSFGRVTLVGDAAHPVQPHLAQGGAMALEDAHVLARCLAANTADPETALKAYEEKRLERCKRVMAASARNGTLFQLQGPMRQARNLGLRLADRLAPSWLLSRYDWLYGFDVTREKDAAGDEVAGDVEPEEELTDEEVTAEEAVDADGAENVEKR